MDVAELFRALGDPVRLKIVCMLAEAGELCVCNIVDELEMHQPAVSHHLARLRYAGLLRARKQGQWVHYSLSLDILEESALAFLQQLVQTAKAAKSGSAPCLRAEPSQIP